MALADTARLIASLELQDKFSGPAGRAEGSLGRIEGRFGTLNRSTQQFSRGIGTAVGSLARIGTGAAVAGIGLLAVNIKAGVDSLKELENVTVATNTVIESTQGVAGITADRVRALAEEYESLNATMDDKVIQAGENLLLTFTNIREDAFEPALEAALNMNEAMGGGEEGLQSTIIQIGKALQDPIRGATALRRVGVALTVQQQEQIKTLVEQNDLYGAQQIILNELGTEFGGRFAAAGDTAAGSQARLRDAVEDLQVKLAGPLLPAIDRVREKLTDFLTSPAALAGAEKLGDAIAGLFTDENIDRGIGTIERGIELLTTGDFSGATSGLGSIVESVGDLPWASIGDAARLLGTGSKALLDAFLGLPPWVQTAVLTGWGLNKLTGGMFGSIISQLGSGLIKGVLGMNAGVVNINAAKVTGGGGGVPGGGGAGALGLLSTAGIAAAILASITVAATEVNKDANPTGFGFNELASQQGVSRVQVEGDLLDLSAETGRSVTNLQAEMIPLLQRGNLTWDQIVEQVETGRDATVAAADRSTAAARDAIPWLQRNKDEIRNLNSSEGTRFGHLYGKVDGTNAVLGQVRNHEAVNGGILAQIRDKKPPSTLTKLNVTTNVYVSAAQVTTESSSYRETVGGYEPI